MRFINLQFAVIVVVITLLPGCVERRTGAYEMTWEVAPTIHTDLAPADDVNLTFTDDPCTTYHIVSRDLGSRLKSFGSEKIVVVWTVDVVAGVSVEPVQPVQIGPWQEWNREWGAWTYCRDHDPDLPVPKR